MRTLRIVSVVLVIATVLAACTTPATPTAAPAAQAPAAAAPAAGTGWCSNVRIVFFPGGPAGGVFANNVYNGAKQAAGRSRREGGLCVLRLGSPEDDPAVQ